MSYWDEGRSGLSRASIGYGLDYGLKHKQGIDPTNPENKKLLNDRDPELIMREARAITVASNNCNPYDPEPEFREIRKKFGQTKNKNQAGAYVLSCSDRNWEELGKFIADRDYQGDISKVKEIDKYQEYGEMALELGEYIAGGGNLEKGKNEYQVAVQTHADGSHGKHAHIEVNTVNMVDGRKYAGTHDLARNAQKWADKVYESRGLGIYQKGVELVPILDENGNKIAKLDKNGKPLIDKKTGEVLYQMKTQRKGGYDVAYQGSKVEDMLSKGKYSYIDDMNCQFELVLADKNVKSRKDAIKKLHDRGIVVDQWNDQSPDIKLHWKQLKADVKKHGELTQKKGTPSRITILKTYESQTATSEVEANPEDRKLTHDNLQTRLEKYEHAMDSDEFKKRVLERREHFIKPPIEEVRKRMLELEKFQKLNKTIKHTPHHHYDWRNDLDVQVYEVLLDKNADVHSREDFEKELEKRHIKIDQMDDIHKHVKAHFTSLKEDVYSHGRYTAFKGDESPSKRLGKALTRPELDEYLKQSVEERSQILQVQFEQTKEKQAVSIKLDKPTVKPSKSTNHGHSGIKPRKLSPSARKKLSAYAKKHQEIESARDRAKIRKFLDEENAKKKQKIEESNNQTQTTTPTKKVTKEDWIKHIGQSMDWDI